MTRIDRPTAPTPARQPEETPAAAPETQAADAHAHTHAHAAGDGVENFDVDTDAGFLAAIRADNRHLIDEHDPSKKLAKIETSPFIFFRGTAGLFYRRMQGVDQDKPRTLVAGDIHPENFGVMQGSDGTLSFGIDDFDEAALAPFSWDLRRGATGFALLAGDRGFTAAEKRTIAAAFVDGYQSAVKTFAMSDLESHPFLSDGDPPQILKDLFKKSKKRKQSKILKKYTEDGAFKTKKNLTPAPELVDDMQRVVNDYRRTLQDDAPGDADFFKVKDVAIRTDAGTASLGLSRYYILVEGKDPTKDDDIILEMKESLPSALVGLGGSPLHARYSVAAQANRAAHVMRDGEDPLHGYTEYGGKEFILRERSPKVVDPDLDKWDAGEIAEYARACGGSVAASHARYGRADERISEAMTDAFSTEIVDFAMTAEAEVTSDHARYVALRASDEI
jgi:uncharacterized protein (DUF2252 family)